MQESPNRWTRIALWSGLILLILSGWIALIVSSSQARDRQVTLENQLAATKAEYQAKERLLHITDEELILAAAKAYFEAIVELRSGEEKVTGQRVKKLEGDFATVFTDTATGGGPTVYFKRVNGIWTIFAVGEEIDVDEDFRARYGIPATYTAE